MASKVALATGLTNLVVTCRPIPFDTSGARDRRVARLWEGFLLSSTSGSENSDTLIHPPLLYGFTEGVPTGAPSQHDEPESDK